jgi:hypothetical protein
MASVVVAAYSLLCSSYYGPSFASILVPVFADEKDIPM